MLDISWILVATRKQLPSSKDPQLIKQMSDTDRIERIMKEYDRDAPLFDRFRKDIDRLLNELVRVSGIPFSSVTSRLKDQLSFQSKIRSAEKYDSARSVTDFAGARVITYFAEDVDRIASLIRQPANFEIDARNSVDKRRALSSSQFGYQSLHLVVSLSRLRLFMENRAFEGLKIEIQIRSLLQHTWAEIEHKYYKSEKGLPPSIRRRVSILAGVLELADNEFIAVRKDADAVTMDLPICRAEGLTELVVPDFPMDLPVAVLLAQSDLRSKALVLFMNSNITSRLIGPGYATEVEMHVEAGFGPVLKGKMCAANAMMFSGVFSINPSSTEEYVRVRISGLRVNAFQLGVSSTVTPTTIQAMVAICQMKEVDIGQWKETRVATSERLTGSVDVARVAPALQFTMGAAKVYPVGDESKFRAMGIQVFYQPLFREAFRAADRERSSAEMLPVQGTRLLLRVNNLPLRARCFASVRDNPHSGNQACFSLTEGHGNGGGTFSQLAASKSHRVDDVEVAFAETGMSGASAFAIWECTSSIPVDQVPSFYTIIEFPCDFNGVITLSGSLAPLSAVGTASSTDPVPRFGDTSTPIAVRIDPEVKEVKFDTEDMPSSIQ